MNTFYRICIGLSIGVAVGFLLGGIKLHTRKNYSDAQISATKKLINRMAFLLKYVTFLLLTLGLIWCVYFLVLGLLHPGQADYANNMAELITAVLTVISIIFAFVEFLRRADDKEKNSGS